MIDPGWQRPSSPADRPPSAPPSDPGRAARTRTRNIAALTALSVTAALGIAATPALLRGLAGDGAHQPAAAQRVTTVAAVTPAASPTPVLAPQPATASPPPPAPTPVPMRSTHAPAASSAVAAPAAVAPASVAQVVVGPGAGCCFSQSGAWTADEAGGSPVFRGPYSWTTSGAASFQWTLGSAAVQRGGPVRVRVWIPSEHAGATVAYTVSSTGGGTPQTVIVSQNPTNGWYLLPGTFAPGTIAVRLTYVRPSTGPNGAACAGCDAMAAAQVRFDLG
jgi:hypothetical protein